MSEEPVPHARGAARGYVHAIKSNHNTSKVIQSVTKVIQSVQKKKFNLSQLLQRFAILNYKLNISVLYLEDAGVRPEEISG
jgi:hypothetical protein